MGPFVKAGIAALLAASLFLGAFFFWRSSSQPNEGIKKIATLDKMETTGVPIFKAIDIVGNPVDLETLKGQVLIINFWASWCPPCVEEVPSLISLVEAMGNGIKLIAISGDSTKEDIQAFLKVFPKLKQKNIIIILDADRSLSRQYGVEGLPESFIVDKNLRLAKKIVGGINWHNKDSVGYLTELGSRK